MTGPGYDAFVSYRRSDGGTIARWLRRELEAFRPPRSLRDRFARKLKVYQDTAYERGTSDFYEHSIRPALMASRYLLVIATPDAMRRPQGAEDWIQREVDDFARGPNGANVIAVRGAGEFNGPLPADLAARFPNIEIVDLRGASRFWFLNPAKAARLTDEKLKLIAPLLDLPAADMPRLRQEEEKRQQARLGATVGVTFGVLVAISTLSVFALQSRFKATAALESSMFSTGRMIQSIAVQLQREGGADGLRSRLLTEACDLIDKLRTEADREPEIASLVTCRNERAVAHEQLGEHDLARRQLDEAITMASARAAKDGRADSGEQVVRAHQQLVEFFTRRQDTDAAEAALRRLHAEAAALSVKHKFNGNFPEAEGEALGQLGDIVLKRGDKTKAGELYDQAAEAVSRAVDQSLEKREARLLEWLARLYRLGGEQRMELGDDAGAGARFGKALETRARVASGEGDQPMLDVEQATALAHKLAIARRKGDWPAAQKARDEALASIARALAPDNLAEAFKQRAGRVKTWLDQQDLTQTEN